MMEALIGAAAAVLLIGVASLGLSMWPRREDEGWWLPETGSGRSQEARVREMADRTWMLGAIEPSERVERAPEPLQTDKTGLRSAPEAGKGLRDPRIVARLSEVRQTASLALGLVRTGRDWAAPEHSGPVRHLIEAEKGPTVCCGRALSDLHGSGAWSLTWEPGRVTCTGTESVYSSDTDTDERTN